MNMKTKQEVFDIGVAGILAQGEQSSNDLDECMYRNENGLKCVIGMCIPDEKYRPESEESIHRLCLDDPDYIISCGLNPEDVVFYQDLQDIHDCCEVHDWPERFKELSIMHGLSTRVIDEWLAKQL